MTIVQGRWNSDDSNLDNLGCAATRGVFLLLSATKKLARMVGVAGRSKACHTCRQRRIRCDAEKPSCRNCLKSGRSCAGYQRTQVFILSNYTQSGGGQTLTLDASSSPLRRKQQQHIKRQHLAAALPQVVSARNATRDQFLANLIDRQLPSCILASGHLNDHRKWLLHLPDIASLTPAMEYAILALSTAALEQDSDFGHRRGQTLKLYTRGLYELQKAIDGPKTRLDDQTLAACVLLGMFEFSECPGRTVSAYKRHYQGAMALLQLRGPEQHIGGLAHDVFQVLRMHTAFQGLSQNPGSLLAKPAWMKGPWMSKYKTMHDLLLDIFLQVPEPLSRVRAVMLSHPSQSSLTAGLKALSTLLGLDGELLKWFESYQDTYPTLYWPELSTANSSTDNEELGRLYPVSFQFPSYHVAETMILYWTVQILIHASTSSLYTRITSSETQDITRFEEDGLSAEGVDRVSLAQIHHTIEISEFVLWPETSARYICQSVDYFFREEFRGMGSGVTLSPLLVVKACLSRSAKNFSREIAWIDEAIGRIHGNGAGLAACV